MGGLYFIKNKPNGRNDENQTKSTKHENQLSQLKANA